MLRAHLLGRFGISNSNGRDVTPRSRKARGLLGYLLASNNGGERREKLAGLLWSESSIEQAYDSLRHCLSELRGLERAAGVSFLHADRQRVQVDRDRLEPDLALLRSHLAAGNIGGCRHLLTLPDLSLLAGAEIDDPAFDNWLMVERERHAEMLVHDLLGLLRAPEIGARDRVELARAIERLDPYQEDAVKVHMELLAAEGNFAGAAAFFEGYRNRLSREYEVEPSDDLIDLAESLATRAQNGVVFSKNGANGNAVLPDVDVPSMEGVRATDMRGTPMIAVLPMPSVPTPLDLRQVADTFSQELVSTLCRFKEWTIIAPSDMLEAEIDMAPNRIAAALAARRVDYGLMTSISAVAGNTVVNVRLIECDTETVVISDQYPAASENWLAVFNDVCCRIASRIQVGVAASRLRRVAGRSPDQRKAYDLWLEGEALAWMWTQPTEKEAIDLFKKAVSLDDQLACAYGSWASVLNTRWFMFPGWPEDAADRKAAYDLARRAVALDPLDCRNHMHLGWSHLLARRFEPGELHFQLAHDLNPSNPDNLLVCGLANAFCGRHTRAAELCERAFALNPFRPALYWGYRCTVLLLGRDFERCVEAVSNAPDVFPDIRGWAAVAHAHLGNREQAHAALQQFFADIRLHWVGTTAPSDADIRKWFTDVFPIRLPEDRRLLSEGLAKIP